MKQYLEDLNYVLTHGIAKGDRTGTGTLSVFGMQTRYNLRSEFPAVTTKKLAWRAVVSELLWMIEGSGDERRLSEILHGTRDTGKKTVWTENAQAPYWKGQAKFPGDLGRVYGVQWRHWRRYIEKKELGHSGNNVVEVLAEKDEIDQLIEIINGIKRDPEGRRHIINTWNVADLKEMALPPCHSFAQFYVANDELSCQMYQRSGDFLLGIPFNIASYSLLTHMIAQVCNLKVGDFIHTIGDAHLYNNHITQAKEQLARQPLPRPKLWLNPDIKDITKFTMDDIKLIDYQSHSAISAPMAV